MRALLTPDGQTDVGFDLAFARDHVGLQSAVDHADVQVTFGHEVGRALPEPVIERLAHGGVGEVARHGLGHVGASPVRLSSAAISRVAIMLALSLMCT